MIEQFVEIKFRAGTLALVSVMRNIITGYARQGYDLSLRQLYYQLVSQNVVPNSEQSYNRVGSILTDARMAGLIDWGAIVDRGRGSMSNSYWSDPSELIQSAAEAFALDRWEPQPWFVILMVEKQALEGVLQPVCERLHIPFSSNKGYSSATHLYTIGKLLRRKMEDEDKQVCVIYLGDHDPSGIDMTRDVEERLRLFSGMTIIENGETYCNTADQDKLVVRRIALNMDQVQKYNPPPNPTKLTDSRAEGYIQQFGHTCWELDALQPAQLVRLVEDVVAEYRDDRLWGLVEDREQKGKELLDDLATEAADRFADWDD